MFLLQIKEISSKNQQRNGSQMQNQPQFSNKVAKNVQEGRNLDLEEIGIKRTPYVKLINEESQNEVSEKSKFFNLLIYDVQTNVNRFSDLVDTERKLLRSYASKRKENILYQTLEKSIPDLSDRSPISLSNQSFQNLNDKSIEAIEKLVKFNNQRVDLHLKRLTFDQGIYKITPRQNQPISF